MRISDWSSDVCSSDLLVGGDLHPCLQPVRGEQLPAVAQPAPASPHLRSPYARLADSAAASPAGIAGGACGELSADPVPPVATGAAPSRLRVSRPPLYLSRSYRDRSEEHTPEPNTPIGT